jgi:uncharacterized repeat protein (TIGR02543 family)
MILCSLNVNPVNAVTDGDYDCLVGSTPTGTFTIESNEVKSSTNDCAGTVNIPNGVEKIANLVFYERLITSVTIPNTVTEIGANAFESTRLVSLTIPNSVRTIGTGVFQNITTLNYVSIGNSITTISDYAFSGTALTSVSIPNSVTIINNRAFYFIASLTSVTFGNSVDVIGPGAFRETGITEVTIPNSVRTIGDEAFYETKLTTLDLGNGVTSIGVYSFGGINDGINHLDVVIPDSVTTLSSNAFGQSNLGNVVIGDGLETIEVAVFYNNYGQGARSIIFGSNLKRIKEAAFLGVNASNIILPDSLEHLETRAFEQTNPSLIYIPNSLFTLAVGAFDNSTTDKIIYCGSDSSIISYVYPVGKSSVCEKIVKQNSNFSQVEEKYQTSATALDIELNTFNRIGYTFESWNTQKNGSGIKYTDGQNFNFLSNLTLYAQWSSLTSNSEDNQIEGTWVGKQSITCPSLNPWENEQLGFAENVAPVISSAENLVGKYITQKSLNELGNSGVIFDAFPKKVSTATETLPVFGCKDKLLNGAINQPIQFIAGGYTLQSNAHGYINTSDLKWHDTNGVTLYTNTAAFMHTIKFTNPGKYVVVLTEQPDASRGLIPTYGVRSVRFVININ